MRRAAGCLLVAAQLLVLFPVSALAAENGPRHVLLSWVNDASTTMTVSWRDETEDAEVLQIVSQTQYDEKGFAEAKEFAADCKDISLNGSGAWHYEATVTGLAPATTYVYRVGGEGAWSEIKSFTTDDPAAETLTFAYMGDVQPYADSEAEFALWGELAQTMVERNPELSFAILGGDIVNSGISLEQFDLFASNAEGVFSSVPLFATPGNHESNFIGGKPELYLDYFAFPKNGPEGFEEEIYSFNVANCHVLSLNSWIYSGEQPLTEEDYERVSNWMKADLAASTADWQIVVTHIPVYAVHSDTTATKVKANWAPIFEQYGVDLVFEGHQHVYSRSYPMYEGKVDHENGITYIMGVSGSKFYDSADETFAERTIYNTATYQLVQVDGDTLTVQTLDADGNELDYVTVQQRVCNAPAFVDVSEDVWYAAAVDYVRKAGLFNGTGDGSTFSPDGSMTRAMFATVLHRYAGKPENAAELPFEDTAAGSWYAGAAAWTVEHGYIKGVGQNRFAPENEITLEQMVTILYRYTNAQAPQDAAVPESMGTVSSWAHDAMCWANENGLFDQIGGTLTAAGAATRAQVAGLFLALEAVEPT